MRLNKFESAGMEPLGEGDEKKVFVDPNNEQRVISERKEVAEKDTPRQLKGRYYLGKIAHALLPTHIPEIYQAGQSTDGKQTVDVERIPHSEGQALLQELRRTGQDEGPAMSKIYGEQGKAMGNLDGDLEQIGLGFAFESNVGNYTKNEVGNTYFLETFKPWQADDVDPKGLMVLFDEELLKSAIDALPDEKMKEDCNQHLERLVALLEEEKKDTKELQENRKANLFDCGPGIENFERLIGRYTWEGRLTKLHAITTQEEALSNELRNDARFFRDLAFKLLNKLRAESNITDEQYEELHEKYMVLQCAIGVINGGVVDHTR